MTDVGKTPFLGGAIQVLQPLGGYRFSLDAVVLAGFVRCGPGDALIEAGTGCGVIPLILARRTPFRRMVAVEIQDRLARCAAENVAINGLAGRVEVVHGDVRSVSIQSFPPAFQVMLSNPPYRRVGDGRLNPDPEKAVARHEIHLSLAELASAARRFLSEDGRCFLVHLAGRERDALDAMASEGFYLRRTRRVFSFPESEKPSLCLLEWGLDSGNGALEEGPFVVYASRGRHSAEMEGLLADSPSYSDA